MEFKDFPLKQEILEALHGRGLTTPTPIQAAALPLALEGKDLIGQARTGTGKTLAFALPIAERLAPSQERGRKPRALVLTPTRELALQVASELTAVAPHLKVVAVYGGTGYTKQREELARGADVVVATPGRALDYLRQGVLDLSRVEVAVLDEADEMLSMGFEEEVEALLSATPPSRQTLLFSATLPSWAKRLAERYMKNPVLINVIKDEPVTYEEEAVPAPVRGRLEVLSDLLYVASPDRAMVFTRTKAETEEIAQGLLRLGHPAQALHGDLSQGERERVLGAFRQGEVRVLVATDVAARGLDIPQVDLVVHYRLPDRAEAYQHRSGRTGRAGRGGRVVLLYGPRERRDVEALERAVGRRFKRVNPPTPEEVLEAKWRHLLARLARVPEKDYRLYQDFAGRLFAEGRVEVVAALMALLLGGAPAERSLLTGEEGWRTYKATGPRLSLPRLVALLKGQGLEVGKVAEAEGGFYVDLRPEARPEVAGLRLEPARRVEGLREAPGRARRPVRA
ncbi:DEAD/DEAH box helicase [Thermus thermophilus]|uniref:DEAD/DEAH box helicase n=1 Tax=Thermus thermophilus TaxID=274 RepID=UPI001FCA6A4B|nr:DEAD/DEAH box helicase [Thermus thermophilus]BDG29530.1 DEAD/DEAH box helicase [Thermus thermophilus]